MTRIPIPFTIAPALKNIALLLVQLETAFPSIVKLMIKVIGAKIPHKINPSGIVKGAGELDEYMWSSAGTLLTNMAEEIIIAETENIISFQTLTRSASTPITNDAKSDNN